MFTGNKLLVFTISEKWPSTKSTA